MEKLHLYYHELEKLAVAVAIGDNKLPCETKAALREKIRGEFAPHEQFSKSWVLNYTEKNGNECDHIPDLQHALDNFSHFVELHYEPGDRLLLERSLKFLEKITRTYSGEKRPQILEMVKNEICGLIYV